MLQRILSSAGLDARVCAQLIGINPQVFMQWVSGQSPIPESIVPLLAAVLSVQPSVLTLTPKAAQSKHEADLMPQIWYKFRNDRLVDADREYVILIRQIGYYLNELEEVTRQKSVQWRSVFDTIRAEVDVQAPPREQGKAAARIFRQSTALGHGATGSGEVLRGLLRNLGVLVFEAPIKDSQIEGCSFYVGSASSPRPCAFANSHHATWFRRNAILMHEVAHAVFEPFTGAALDFVGADFSSDVVEVRAQAFAQESLLPREVLLRVGQDRGVRWSALDTDGLAALVAATHVEQRLVVAAAVDAGFVEAEKADVLAKLDVGGTLKTMSEHALDTDEYLELVNAKHGDWIGKRSTTVGPRSLRLPVGYVNSIVDAYRGRQISPGKAAEYLMIEESELFDRFGDIYEEVAV